MAVLLQVDFPFTGPWGDEMGAGMKELATPIPQEPGLLWKTWPENRDSGEAGGIYLSADATSADAYLQMHRARLLGFGIPVVNAKLFDINLPLSLIDRAPLS